MNPFPRVRTQTPEQTAETEARKNSTLMLLAIGKTGKHLYQGTVTRAEISRRRAKNKAARRARRAHR